MSSKFLPLFRLIQFCSGLENLLKTMLFFTGDWQSSLVVHGIVHRDRHKSQPPLRKLEKTYKYSTYISQSISKNKQQRNPTKDQINFYIKLLLSIFILFDEKWDYLVSGSADDGREDSSRGVVPGESRLTHSGTVVHNQSSNIVVTHVLSVLFNKTNVRIIPRGLIVL